MDTGLQLQYCCIGLSAVHRRDHQIRQRSDSQLVFASLEKPTILFSDNHLLVVNKPTGWHSVPNPGPPSPKCLMSKLKSMKLGGGSNKDFLLSIHRLDQPCSGIILFAKTSKAATRITTLWKKKKVTKEYLCVISRSQVDRLLAVASPIDDGGENAWIGVHGVLQSSKNSRSVVIRPVSEQRHTESIDRQVSLKFTVVESPNKNRSAYVILRVQTNEGSRHMVRAMLAQIGGCPIAGDLRYGPRQDESPLRDQSVALHAYRVSLDPSLKLGSLGTLDFEAPIPRTWTKLFGISPSVARDLI